MSYKWNWSPWEEGYHVSKYFEATSFVGGRNLDITKDERGLTLAKKSEKVFDSTARIVCMLSLNSFDYISLDCEGNVYYNDQKKYSLMTTKTSRTFVGAAVFSGWLLLFTTEAMHRIPYVDVVMERINSSTVQEDYFTFPSTGYAYRSLFNREDTIFYFGCGNCVYAFDQNFSLYTPLTLQKNDNIVAMSQVWGHFRLYAFREYPVLNGKVILWDGKSKEVSQTIVWNGSPIRSIIPMGKYDLAAVGLRFVNTHLSAMSGYDNTPLELLPLVWEPYSATQATNRLYLGTLDGVYLQKTLKSGQTVLLPYVSDTSEWVAISEGHISAIISDENGFSYSIQQAQPVSPRIEKVKIFSGKYVAQGEVCSGLFAPKGSCQKQILKRVRIAYSGEVGCSVRVSIKPQQANDWIVIGEAKCSGAWACDEFCPSGVSGNGFFARVELLSNKDRTKGPSLYGFEAVCDDIS